MGIGPLPQGESLVREESGGERPVLSPLKVLKQSTPFHWLRIFGVESPSGEEPTKFGDYENLEKYIEIDSSIGIFG